MVWIVVATVHALILYYIGRLDLVEALSDSLVFNILFAIIGFGISYSVRFARLDGPQVLNTIVTHLVACLFLVSAWLFAGRSILTLIFKQHDFYLGFLQDTVLWRGIIGFLFYTIVAFTYYLFQYYSDFQQQKLRESETNRLLKETELRLLKIKCGLI